MAELQRGGNAPVAGNHVAVRVDWAGPAGVEADISAYLLGEDGRVSGDHDMIFYNQPSGAGGAIAFQASGGASTFNVDLSRLPASVARIPFCLTVDGGQTFASLSRADLSVSGGGTDIRFPVPREGASEAAMILGELYRRQGAWKFRAVAQGFNGGLGPLARSFGIQVDDEPAATASQAPAPAPAAAPAPSGGPISLEKKVAAKAPHLVNLAKTAAVSLEKRQLDGVRAQVVLVLDGSGSMWSSYDKGDVQQIIERVVPLAVHFDDDGALDSWLFSDIATQLKPVTLDNVNGYVTREILSLYDIDKIDDLDLDADFNEPIFSGNNEPAVIEKIVSLYGRSSLPVYVVFVSDGGVYADKEIKRLITDASGLPIFWQFLGYAGSNYGILKKLDTMRGRKVDNANFFAIDDLNSVSDDQLYDRLLNEFPSWLREARGKGIIR